MYYLSQAVDQQEYVNGRYIVQHININLTAWATFYHLFSFLSIFPFGTLTGTLSEISEG